MILCGEMSEPLNRRSNQRTIHIFFFLNFHGLILIETENENALNEIFFRNLLQRMS